MLSFFRSPGAAPDRITPSDAVTQTARGDLVLIDVRERAEIAQTGKARGALHVPLGDVATRCDPDSPACLPGLERSKPVAIYCASGARSGRAAAQLRAMGYATVYNLGSLHDWQAGGGAVVR